MTIRSEHVGWGLLVIILFLPWIPVIFYDAPAFPDTAPWYVMIPMAMRGIEVVAGCILVIAGGLFCVVMPFILITDMLSGDIKFEWHISLPKFGRSSPKHSRDHELFLKLGTLDQNSPEWLEIYKKVEELTIELGEAIRRDDDGERDRIMEELKVIESTRR